MCETFISTVYINSCTLLCVYIAHHRHSILTIHFCHMSCCFLNNADPNFMLYIYILEQKLERNHEREMKMIFLHLSVNDKMDSIEF